MKKDEVYELLNRIKANYSDFRNTNEDVIKEWNRRLYEYDPEEINNALDKYLEYGDKPPLINQLTEGLKKTNERLELRGTFICPNCGLKYSTYEACLECVDRDRTLAYITKMSEKFNLNPNEYFLPSYTRCKDLNTNYDKWIYRIIQEQKQNPILKEKELIGLRQYYKYVLAPKGYKI